MPFFFSSSFFPFFFLLFTPSFFVLAYVRSSDCKARRLGHHGRNPLAAAIPIPSTATQWPIAS
jgi:hypothetical protein